MVADMYYNGTDVKLEDSIYYWAYVLKDSIPTNTSKDTVQIENGVVLNKSSFGIVLRNNPNKKVFIPLHKDQIKKLEIQLPIKLRIQF